MQQERIDDDDHNNGVSAATLLPPPSATTTTTTTTSRMAYLNYEDWSPRYETTFYTVKLVGFELLTESPSSSSSTTTTTTVSNNNNNNNCVVGGKSNFPAYYYKIKIFCGHQNRSIKRRYSEFKWLYNQIQSTIDKKSRRMENDNNNNNDGNNNNIITMPPGTCIICFPQNDIFAQNRLEQLREFLCCDLLQQPDIAHHPSVVKFLELDKIIVN